MHTLHLNAQQLGGRFEELKSNIIPSEDAFETENGLLLAFIHDANTRDKDPERLFNAIHAIGNRHLSAAVPDLIELIILKERMCGKDADLSLLDLIR